MYEMIIGLVLVAVSTSLVVMQFLPRSVDDDFERKAGIYHVRVWSAEAKLFSVFYPVIRLVLPLVSNISAIKVKNKLGRVLVSAGLDEEINADELISFGLVLAILLPFVLMAFVSTKSAIIFGVLGGFLYPVIWVYDKRKVRQAEIVRDLPGRVDMLALSMEGGLDFNSAVKQIIDQHPKDSGGPLIQEFRVFMQNMRLGMSRNEALEELAVRVDDAEIYSFVSVLVQADLLGASVGSTLKEQGKKLRDERFMSAEREGAAASQKMMIPMMIFIFPLMFGVIFAPFLIKMFYGQ